MLRSLFSVLLLLTTIPLAPRLAGQQPALNSSSCPCTLRGTVIDSVTGNPIHGALVLSSAGTSRDAFTDAEGRFQFDALPAGTATVQVAKPGYLSEDTVVFHSTKSFSIPVGTDSPPAVLKLTPEGIVYGQVTDENGQPLEGFSVLLVYRNPRFRSNYRGSQQRATTDDEGHFRISGLYPGTGFLSVDPPHEPAKISTRSSEPPQGFAAVFYPTAFDMASATPIRVQPGKPVQADFSLKREPYVRLSGTLSGAGSESQISVNLQDSLGEPLPLQITFDPATRSFSSKWIPPGVYTLSATLSDQNSRDASPLFSARLSVNAHSSLTGIHLVLQPTIKIPVVIRGRPPVATDDQQPADLFILLLAKGSDFRGASRYWSSSRSDDSQDQFAPPISGVEPGTYDVYVTTHSSSFYVESLTWGSVDLLRDPLVLAASGSVPPIDVVVREGAAAFSGTVVSGDHPAPGAIVVFAPGQRTPSFAFAGPDGSFHSGFISPSHNPVIALYN